MLHSEVKKNGLRMSLGVAVCLLTFACLLSINSIGQTEAKGFEAKLHKLVEEYTSQECQNKLTYKQLMSRPEYKAIPKELAKDEKKMIHIIDAQDKADRLKELLAANKDYKDSKLILHSMRLEQIRHCISERIYEFFHGSSKFPESCCALHIFRWVPRCHKHIEKKTTSSPSKSSGSSTSTTSTTTTTTTTTKGPSTTSKGSE